MLYNLGFETFLYWYFNVVVILDYLDLEGRAQFCECFISMSNMQTNLFLAY